MSERTERMLQRVCDEMAQRDIIDALEPLSEESTRRVIRVVVACHEARCLDDLGIILKDAGSA